MVVERVEVFRDDRFEFLEVFVFSFLDHLSPRVEWCDCGLVSGSCAELVFWHRRPVVGVLGLVVHRPIDVVPYNVP